MAHRDRKRQRQRIKVGVQYNVEGLDYDGERLTCGLCGKRYKALNVHVRRTHHWLLDDYRKTFGLNYTQPLWIPELSQRRGEDLRERGLVGKNLRFDLYLFARRPEYSIQGKYELSVGSRGKIMTMTPAKVKAQKDNQRKSQTLDTTHTCSICGKTYFGRRCDKGRQNHYCPECRHKARRMIICQWQIDHPGKVREATRRYRERRKLAGTCAK